MKVLVTGANGFIGRCLTDRLLQTGAVAGVSLKKLILIDQQFEATTASALVRQHAGDMADATLLRRALADGVDCVFHLASVPGGLAERNHPLGQRVNIGATQELLLQLREQAQPAVVVFASSIAVYGNRLPARMDEATPPNPHLSYGTQKVIAELLLRDFTRRGWIDGRALRLPGVVARPRGPAGSSGLLSAYMSDIQHALAAGERYTCPVSAQAVSWWMSAACCVDNLLQAAVLPAAQLDTQRTWVLPVLRHSMAELVDALARRYGANCHRLVSYRPDAALEAAFGRYPPLATPAAEALGLHHDGNIDNLLRNALPG